MNGADVTQEGINASSRYQHVAEFPIPSRVPDCRVYSGAGDAGASPAVGFLNKENRNED